MNGDSTFTTDVAGQAANLANRIDSLVELHAARTVAPAPPQPAPPAAPVAAPPTATLPPVAPPTQEPNPQQPMNLNLSVLGNPQHEALIMIVDDEEANLRTVQRYLQLVGYKNFVVTTDAREALGMLEREKPDVVLLDIQMPNISGLDILSMIDRNASPTRPPVIVLTASTDAATKRKALDLGASDFLTKPIDPNDLLPRVRNTIAVKMQFDQLTQQTAEMEKLVERRTAELLQSRQQLILSLAKAAEHRDNDTSNHVLRVGHYAAALAKKIGWPEPAVHMIEQAAQLHDVGKIGIPDAILFKPGKLDYQEYELIKTHCAMGKHIIEPLSAKENALLRTHSRIGENILHDRTSPMLMMASRIAQTHHERWDGTGYPLGLKGNDIPLEGRITAIADVFDALSSKRSYKDAMPREECFQAIQDGAGAHFDPSLVQAFVACSEEVVAIQIAFMDGVE